MEGCTLKTYNTLEAINYLLNIDALAIFDLSEKELNGDCMTKHRFMFLSWWNNNPFLLQWREPNDTVTPRGIEKMQELPLSENIEWVLSPLGRDYLKEILDTKGIRESIGQQPIK